MVKIFQKHFLLFQNQWKKIFLVQPLLYSMIQNCYQTQAQRICTVNIGIDLTCLELTGSLEYMTSPWNPRIVSSSPFLIFSFKSPLVWSGSNDVNSRHFRETTEGIYLNLSNCLYLSVGVHRMRPREDLHSKIWRHRKDRVTTTQHRKNVLHLWIKATGYHRPFWGERMSRMASQLARCHWCWQGNRLYCLSWFESQGRVEKCQENES